MSTFDALLDPVIRLAGDAAQAILSVYEKDDFSVQDKGDTSPLTEADLAAHRVLAVGLGALTPDWPILSEEGGVPEFSERSRWSRYWLVDPLDGTKEFIKRNGEFTVNVALIDNHRPVLGVVHVPATGVYYAASEGRGAFKADADGPVHAIATRPCPTGQRVVAVASRSHQSPEVAAYLEKLGSCDLASMGSSLKICLVAEGRADIYPRLGLTSEWDTAAAQAVLEIAGGQLTDLDGRPMRYNTKAEILNPYFLAFGDGGHDWRQYLPPRSA